MSEIDVGECLANLVSYEEMTQMFGVQKSTVWRWKSMGMLPEPAGELGGRPVWERSTIEEWASRTGRTITY